GISDDQWHDCGPQGAHGGEALETMWSYLVA
ncbi:hypothetical protein EAMG_05438, partial [Escherichia coli M056]